MEIEQRIKCVKMVPLNILLRERSEINFGSFGCDEGYPRVSALIYFERNLTQAYGILQTGISRSSLKGCFHTFRKVLVRI